MKKIIELKGIDLSKHNIVTDWDLVAKQVDFVILRAGGNYGGYYKDSRFERYYDACKLRNIPVGAYYDAGKEFYETDKGIAYAKHFKELISGKVFEYPVYIDIEVTPRKYRKFITEAAIAFCREMEASRYFVGIYGSDISTFHDQLDITKLSLFSKWVARYGAKKPSYVKDYAMWQYTSTGNIAGIKGNVDRDISFVDYPRLLKGVHLNGN